jgi:hypothetical protein
MAPNLFERAVGDSVTATLSDYHDDNCDYFYGGSTLTSKPIPLVSGLELILFRPWPTEVQRVDAFLAGLEVWAMAAFGLLNWTRGYGKIRFRAQLGLLTHVIVLLLLGFFFSYMYNMGLVVRQRLMCFPALLAIYTWPLLVERKPIKTGLNRYVGSTMRRAGSTAIRRRNAASRVWS